MNRILRECSKLPLPSPALKVNLLHFSQQLCPVRDDMGLMHLQRLFQHMVLSIRDITIQCLEAVVEPVQDDYNSDRCDSHFTDCHAPLINSIPVPPLPLSLTFPRMMHARALWKLYQVGRLQLRPSTGTVSRCACAVQLCIQVLTVIFNGIKGSACVRQKRGNSLGPASGPG
jgi:hypothetical protein